ncbi:7067_t:CDS:1, partial [Racocetra persica]
FLVLVLCPKWKFNKNFHVSYFVSLILGSVIRKWEATSIEGFEIGFTDSFKLLELDNNQ